MRLIRPIRKRIQPPRRTFAPQRLGQRLAKVITIPSEHVVRVPQPLRAQRRHRGCHARRRQARHPERHALSVRIRVVSLRFASVHAAAVFAVPERVLVAKDFDGAVEDAADVERVSGEGIEGFHGGGHRWVGRVFDVVHVEGDERHRTRSGAAVATATATATANADDAIGTGGPWGVEKALKLARIRF